MMYRKREKCNSRAQSLWSVLKYDLGTALDVLGLPCLVRLSENDVRNVFNDVETGDYVVKFERRLSFFNVRARVCELTDIDWHTWCKGEEFVVHHRRLVGTEFLIPVGYQGKIRLVDRAQNRDYFSILELINDFPKFVRVEKDTACFSPGDTNYHVVHKGTILELDRVTQNNRFAGGSRDNFLICFDRKSGREIAFRVMSPVHFRKVKDTTKYTVKDFIEHLSLPQKVEFLDVNPYDVVIQDDVIANDILIMLSGPIELIELCKSEYLIGQIRNEAFGDTSILALPSDSESLEDFLVYIPSTSIIENEDCYADTVINGQTNCDIILQKLYSYSVNPVSLLLKSDIPPPSEYDIPERPDTPPLPPKYDFSTLRSTLSEQLVGGPEAEDGTMETCRRRFLSTGDLKSNRSRSSLRSVERESRGIRDYLSHLTHRFKSNATQVLYGLENQSDDVFKDENTQSQPSRKRSLRNLWTRKRPSLSESSFVCYLNFPIEEPANDSSTTTHPCNLVPEEVSENTVNDMIENDVNEQIHKVSERVTPSNPSTAIVNGGLPHRSINFTSEEVIYASVNKNRNKLKKNENLTTFLCQDGTLQTRQELIDSTKKCQLLFEEIKRSIMDEDHFKYPLALAAQHLPANTDTVSIPYLFHKRLDQLNSWEIRLLVAGDISAGKSTLMNRMMGDSYMPVQFRKATKVMCDIEDTFHRPEKRATLKLADSERGPEADRTFLLDTRPSDDSWETLRTCVKTKEVDDRKLKRVLIKWPLILYDDWHQTTPLKTLANSVLETNRFATRMQDRFNDYVDSYTRTSSRTNQSQMPPQGNVPCIQENKAFADVSQTFQNGIPLCMYPFRHLSLINGYIIVNLSGMSSWSLRKDVVVVLVCEIPGIHDRLLQPLRYE